MDSYSLGDRLVDSCLKYDTIQNVIQKQDNVNRLTHIEWLLLMYDTNRFSVTRIFADKHVAYDNSPEEML